MPRVLQQDPFSDGPTLSVSVPRDTQQEFDARLEHLGFDYHPESAEWGTEGYVSLADYGDGLRHVAITTGSGQLSFECEALTAGDVELWPSRKDTAVREARERREQWEREHQEHLKVERCRQAPIGGER